MSGKPGKRGGGGGEEPAEAAEAAEIGRDAAVGSRLAELKDKVARAAELIAGLRESNHALKAEVADLSRKLAAADAPPPPSRDPEPSPGEEAASNRERDRLELLLQERKTIRRKVEKLIERVGRLES